MTASPSRGDRNAAALLLLDGRTGIARPFIGARPAFSGRDIVKSAARGADALRTVRIQRLFHRSADEPVGIAPAKGPTIAVGRNGARFHSLPSAISACCVRQTRSIAVLHGCSPFWHVGE